MRIRAPDATRLVMDDEQDEGGRVTTNGTWDKADSGEIPQSYDGRCLTNEGTDSNHWVKFSPALSEPGIYWVYVFFPPHPGGGKPPFSTDTMVNVKDKYGTIHTAKINQQTHGGKWYLLSEIDDDFGGDGEVPAKYEFQGGAADEYVQFFPGGSVQTVVADAVAFVKHSLGAKNLTFDKGCRKKIDIGVKNRQFATLGELTSLIEPACLDGASKNYTFTDDAAEGFLKIYKVSRDGTAISDEFEGSDDDGDGMKDEDDEGDIYFDIADLISDPDAENWKRIFSYLTVLDVDKNDARWHGRVNMNTGTRAMIMALAGMQEFPDKGRRLADAIVRGRTPVSEKQRHGYRDIVDLFAIANKWGGTDIPRASCDGYDNDADGEVDANEGYEGNVDSASSDTLSVAGSPWSSSEHRGKIVFISSGRGCGQYRLITANGTGTLTVSPDWTVVPVKGSVCRISSEYQGDVDFLSGDGKDNDMDGLTDEIGEGIHFFFTRIANLITFRSEIFDVIVRGRVQGGEGTGGAQAQLRAIVDRSTSDPVGASPESLGRPVVRWKRWE
jgi:hypothetical protein